jgi:hypothetical protein
LIINEAIAQAATETATILREAEAAAAAGYHL